MVILTPIGKNKQICMPKSDALSVIATLDTGKKQIKIIYEKKEVQA